MKLLNTVSISTVAHRFLSLFSLDKICPSIHKDNLGNCLTLGDPNRAIFAPSYLYIITRSDLSFPQQAVQSGHAIFEASKAFSGNCVEHPNFCLCTVDNESQLKHELDTLVKAGVKIAAWYEPDRNNELTAFASEPISGSRRQLFRHFRLLKMEEAL